MKLFRPKLFDLKKGYRPADLVRDVVAGIIVAIIALPLSIALAIASGVSPEQGLYTAIFAGFVIAAFGGSRVNISGPTAAFATIVAGVVATHGTAGLVTATVLAGILLMLMGLCRLGGLIKYIPMTITTGFTAGIAVTIAIGQIKDFLGLTFAPGTHAVETTEKLSAIVASISTVSLHALIVGAVGLAVLILWPMLGKARLGAFSRIAAKIPPSIIAVVVGILLVELTPLEVNTVGTLYPTLSSRLPAPALPDFSPATVTAVLPNALTIALLAAIESLLSCVVSDGMIGDRHNSNTELMAQGLGNVTSGLFGGIPATGAIARTAANVKNGGRSPVSGMVHAVVLLLFLVLLMPLAKMIPMPIIAAILLMVAYNMSEWRHFVRICRFSAVADILVLVATFVLTVVFDLVVAIAAGLILSAFLFMKRMSDATRVRRWAKEDTRANGRTLPDGVAVFEVNGPMFFAYADKLGDIAPEEGIHTVIVRMGGVPSVDATAVRSLSLLLATCRMRGITLALSRVQDEPLAVLRKAGFIDALGEERVFATIDDALAAVSADAESPL